MHFYDFNGMVDSRAGSLDLLFDFRLHDRQLYVH